MPVREYELRLKDFSFPKDLPNKRANFRFVIDLRFKDAKGNFASETVIMPGLDSFWECDTSKKNKANYVRDGQSPKFDMSRIDAWDTLVLRFNASDAYMLQAKVFDVDRPGFWDNVTDAVSGIIGTLFGKVKEQVVSLPIVGDTLGSVAEDLKSTVTKLLGGGDKILFKGSSLLDEDEVVIDGRGSANSDKPGDYRIAFSRTVRE